MTEEEYFDSIKSQYINGNQYSAPLYTCPVCNKETVCKNLTICLTSYPPKYRYECINCGYGTVR